MRHLREVEGEKEENNDEEEENNEDATAGMMRKVRKMREMTRR